MASLQPEVLATNRRALVSPMEIGQSFFSESDLADAVAMLRSQNTNRYRSARALKRPLLGISTLNAETGQYKGRQRIQSPRMRAASSRLSRLSSRSNSIARSKNENIWSRGANSIDELGEKIQQDVENTHSKQGDSVEENSEKASELDINIHDTSKVFESEGLTTPGEGPLYLETSKPIEDVRDVIESATTSAKEIFNLKRIDMEKSELYTERPMSIVKTPITMYHDDSQPTIQYEQDPLADLAISGPDKSVPDLFSSSQASIPNNLVQQNDLDVTTLPLRSGSVLTVIPPEQSAWQRSVYIQGAMKLPNPNAIARRGSIASMYTFHDAVEQGWDQGSSFSRKATDDEVIEEILDFFGSFNVKMDFQDWDMPSIKCWEFKAESVSELVQQKSATIEMPVIDEAFDQATGTTSSSGQTHSASDPATATSPISLKRFNSKSKKRPYKRTALTRLTSII